MRCRANNDHGRVNPRSMAPVADQRAAAKTGYTVTYLPALVDPVQCRERVR